MELNTEPLPIVLGTAQFGLPYGIANKSGRPDRVTTFEIVRIAWEEGIREFDTAQDYGESESALGLAFRELGISSAVRVISKIHPDLDYSDPRVMARSLDESLERLGVPHLRGLLLHRESLLDQWSKGMGDILAGFVAEGKVKSIGVSVYSPHRALEALRISGIGLVQVPSNILDRRFEKRGVFEEAGKQEKQVHIRSVFLQGLILMEQDKIPAQLSFASPTLRKVGSLANELGLTRQELALGYLKKTFPEAKLVIGVDTPDQLKNDIICWKRDFPPILSDLVREYFDDVDEKILNPFLWSN